MWLCDLMYVTGWGGWLSCDYALLDGVGHVIPLSCDLMYVTGAGRVFYHVTLHYYMDSIM